MPERKILVSVLWLASSLAMLASVLVAPIWMTGPVGLSSGPDCLRRYFALPLDQPTSRLSSAATAEADLQVNALPCESEEQDGADALDEPRVSFLIPFSFRKVSEIQLIAPRSILSLYPLRC